MRFNQQFYEAVNVPDFHDRLVNIEQFVPDDDKPKLFNVLKKAKENKVNGSFDIIRFYKTDGTLSSYLMRYFYLGKKEKHDRFYGKALNVTELIDLREERELISKCSSDNLIFIRRRSGRWQYSVVSHGLSDVFGLTPVKLEEELNNGEFAKRVINRAELSEFMETSIIKTEKKEDFVAEFYIRNAHGKPQKIHLEFICVSGKYNNIEYIMRSKLVEK